MAKVKGDNNTSYSVGAANVTNDVIYKHGRPVGSIVHGQRRGQDTLIVTVPPWPPVEVPNDVLSGMEDALAAIPGLLEPAPPILNPQRTPPIESAPTTEGSGGKHGTFVHVGANGPEYHGN